jgi:hypothetical protein
MHTADLPVGRDARSRYIDCYATSQSVALADVACGSGTLHVTI